MAMAVARRHRAKGDRRRQELIEIASELFAVSGFRGTGLAAIAEAAGITPAGVLHYFGSKTGLLQAVLEHQYINDLPKYEEAYARLSLDGLRQMLDIVQQGVLQSPALARLFSVLVAENLAPGDPAHDNFVARYRGLRQSFSRWLEEAKAAGSVDPGVDSEALAVELAAFMDGVQLQWLIDPESVDLRAAYDAYVDGLVERIQPQP